MKIISPLVIEQHLAGDNAIEQVRVLRVPSLDGAEPQLAVAVSLTKSGDGDDSEVAIVKRVRRDLVKRMKMTANGDWAGKGAIPKKWIILTKLPVDASGDVDSDALRQQLSSAYAAGAPLTVEQKLRRAIAETLRLPLSDVVPSTSFIRLGGDSISAIEVMARALDDQVVVRMPDILRCGSFQGLAATAVPGDPTVAAGDAAETRPFSLASGLDPDSFLASARSQCQLPSDATIEDAYPLTKLQEGFMALAARQPGSYISKYSFPLPKYIDSSRFRIAWEKTVSLCTNLRTKMVFFDGSSYQVVVNEQIRWDETLGTDLSSAVGVMNDAEMTYGSDLCRYELATGPDGQDYFIWLIHHSVLEGWTLRLILETLHNHYYGVNVPPMSPYSGMIKYMHDLDRDADSEYWKAQLANAKRPGFPIVPSDLATASSNNGAVETVTREERHMIPTKENVKASSTRATILRAAWALLLARYRDSDDVCFGTTVSGRQAPVRGAQRMAGPLIASVPIRIRIDPRQSVAAFLQDVQDQASEMAAHEQFGLQSIARLSPEAQDVCDFSSLLVIQPDKILGYPDVQGPQVLLPQSGTQFGLGQMLEGYYNYPLVLQVHVSDHQAEVSVTHDSRVLSQPQVQALCCQYDHAVQQLLNPTDTVLGDVSLAGP
ncbi:non-ribosomal peptide synthetase [Colletotrichum tofieldiae]|uniref:Non-ribosomal peptide synthetase n=1 Tax=Colletotrichum tofieldiae TaxID=708197 RepID=A0A166MDC8_9PEZI|nr:non-ribosomal peptide synthetase [Colletotrichum tofieldiae]GKT96837.1 non-ribosomal peptide synthetase [Colletotrichum tofieldiae]